MTAAAEMGRTEAVTWSLHVLEEASLDDLVAFLASEGRDDPKHLVSAALAGLKKSGRAHSVGHGRWAPGPGTDADAVSGQRGGTRPARPRGPARGSDDFHEVWICVKDCGHEYDSPQPLKTSWHTNCKKARLGDWVPMKKKDAA